MLYESCSIFEKSRDNQSQAGNPAHTLRLHTLFKGDMVPENSGLIIYRNKIWTLNDSGGDALLYAVDPQNGQVVQVILIENAENRDWEELAQSEDYIYICDIGNNFGRREELRIYRIHKDKIPDKGNAKLNCDVINFSYAENVESNGIMRRSAFDCEAAAFINDSIYLFTKNWETRQSSLYVCPATPGEYKLYEASVLSVDGLITAADFLPDSSLLVLLGYKDYVPFVWVYRDFSAQTRSWSSSQRFDFPDFVNLQSEGLAIQSTDSIYISNESTEFPAALYLLDISSLDD